MTLRHNLGGKKTLVQKNMADEVTQNQHASHCDSVESEDKEHPCLKSCK